MTASTDVAHRIYTSLVTARVIEEQLIKELNRGQRVAVGHPTSGQEAVAAGVCAALDRADLLYCGHRARHWAVSKGVPLAGLIAEYWGRATGISRGWGGDMRMRDPSVGFMSSSPVVAGVLPLAVGAAFGQRLNGTANISVVAFGDGATVHGVFHEALNLAAVWEAPVLFVCENNLYAESTPVEYYSRPVSMREKAATYGIPSITVDGQDALGVFEAVTPMIAEMREHRRPAFIEALTYRYLGHYYGDNTSRYRAAEEEASWHDRDPIALFERAATERGLATAEALGAIRDDALGAVLAAMEYARSSPEPSYDGTGRIDTYSAEVSG